MFDLTLFEKWTQKMSQWLYPVSVGESKYFESKNDTQILFFQCKGLIFGTIGQNVPTTLTILHDHKQLPSFFGASKSLQCFEVWLPLCAVQIQLKQNKHIVLNLFSFDWGKLVYIQWAMFSMLNC